MATRGRKPKPTALKILEGNPGKRPLNENEPIPPKGTMTTLCRSTSMSEKLLLKRAFENFSCTAFMSFSSEKTIVTFLPFSVSDSHWSVTKSGEKFFKTAHVISSRYSSESLSSVVTGTMPTTQHSYSPRMLTRC